MNEMRQRSRSRVEYGKGDEEVEMSSSSPLPRTYASGIVPGSSDLGAVSEVEPAAKQLTNHKERIVNKA
jgi:hypothetical protein